MNVNVSVGVDPTGTFWPRLTTFDVHDQITIVIGDSHDGQIDVCRLVAMVIWSWTSNVVNRGQNVPVGSTPTDTIGPRSRSRLSPRYVLVVLKWRKNRSIFKARRVFSFDFVQSDSFLCQPTDEHNRETFECESDHSRLATIIVDVPVSVENLPVVWIAYNQAANVDLPVVWIAYKDWHFSWKMNTRMSIQSVIFRLPGSLFCNQQ